MRDIQELIEKVEKYKNVLLQKRFQSKKNTVAYVIFNSQPRILKWFVPGLKQNMEIEYDVLKKGFSELHIPSHLEKDSKNNVIVMSYITGENICDTINDPRMRKAIFRKVTSDNQLALPNDDHVVVTNGGMHGLYILFRSILEPGDEVILPDPMWTEIAENIRLGGGKPVPVILREVNGYQYDPEEIEASITPATRAILVNTPHNPTGAVLNRETLEKIASIAEKHNLLLVSDEAYEHVIYDTVSHVSLGSLPAAQGRTISVLTMSKTYAMSGLRLGYLAIRDPKRLALVTFPSGAKPLSRSA